MNGVVTLCDDIVACLSYKLEKPPRIATGHLVKIHTEEMRIPQNNIMRNSTKQLYGPFTIFICWPKFLTCLSEKSQSLIESCPKLASIRALLVEPSNPQILKALLRVEKCHF